MGNRRQAVRRAVGLIARPGRAVGTDEAIKIEV